MVSLGDIWDKGYYVSWHLPQGTEEINKRLLSGQPTMIRLQLGNPNNELNLISDPEIQTGFQFYTPYIGKQLKTEHINGFQTVWVLLLFLFVFKFY
jgi:hypothetical protein